MSQYGDTRIKTILKLLAEKHRIKLALANSACDPNGIDIPARMALFSRLFMVKSIQYADIMQINVPLV